jgi:hypothetical protein
VLTTIAAAIAGENSHTKTIYLEHLPEWKSVPLWPGHIQSRSKLVTFGRSQRYVEVFKPQ